MGELIANIDDLPDRPEWWSGAACRAESPELFFGPSGHYERKEERLNREMLAKSICRMCKVQVTCLEGALARRETTGIWGGTNAKERGVIIKRRHA